EQAEQHGEPDEPGGDAFEHLGRVEGEGEHHHRHAGERQHLVDEHAAATLDAQVLGGDQPRDPDAAHDASAPVSWTWPPATETTRSASAPARSSSWLATSTVAPAPTASRSTASSSSRPAASSPA